MAALPFNRRRRLQGTGWRAVWSMRLGPYSFYTYTKCTFVLLA